MCKRIICGLFSLAMVTGLYAQTKMPPAWQSSYVKITEKGELNYVPDQRGNTIPDFSRVGYHHGDKSIPDYAATKVVEAVPNGDSRQRIQEAIDEVAKRQPDASGHRGTILLKRGVYRIEGSIRIETGGIVLKGEGDHINETRLIATGKEKRALIDITGKGNKREVPGSRTKIKDEFVPVGSHSFRVASAQGFRPGDRIILLRPGTQEWIHAIRMDRIEAREGTKQWRPQEYDLMFEREITRIEGDRIFIDNPVMMEMETRFGGGEIYKYDFEGRISEVGISDLCLESEFQDYEDTQHGWIGIRMTKIENGWVKNVTARYFGYAAVSCESEAKNITVIDCRSFEPKSVITGGLRYSFNNNGQQNLFMNCQATEGRHDYVTGAQVLGPNVFYNCMASQTYGDTGPHHRWAVGTLYDNIVTDGEINVQDRGNWGSGHGWAGVTQVLWNCRVKRAAVQSPWDSGQNYNFGMKGEKSDGRLPGRPDAVWEGQNETNVFPRSLYIAQLMARQNEDLLILTK